MNKVGKAFAILGGFNPCTKAHVELSKILLAKYPGSFIIYMVAPEAYFTTWKKMEAKQVLPVETRIKLLKEALPHQNNIDVQAQPWLHAVDNVKVLNESAGLLFDLYMVIGADKLEELHTWYNGHELIENNKFIVITRSKQRGILSDEVKQFADHFEYLKGNNVLQNVSSTQVREAYLNDNLESVKKIIPPNVYKYLAETQGLFGKAVPVTTELVDN